MHPSRAEFRRHEFVLHDDTNRCLTAYLPDSLAQLVRLLKESENSDLLALSERQLLKKMGRVDKEPDGRDYTLRLRFWWEFERVSQDSGDHPLSMNMASVLGKIIAKEAFYKHYVTDQHRLAFLLCPPENYMVLLEQTLTRAMYRMLDYLEKTELTDENVLKAAKIIDEMYQRFMAVNYKAGRGKIPRPGDDEPGAESETTEETVEQRVARLKAARELTKVEE